MNRLSLDHLVARLISDMPKAELHLHLAGSVRPATALELARERGIVDLRLLEELEGRLTAPERCADQAELLEAFVAAISLLQDHEAIARVTAELVGALASEGTRYVEIRFAPASHTRRGLTLEGAVAAVAAGVEAGRRGRGPIEARLILIAMRDAPEVSLSVVEVALRARAVGVVGIDVAGDERRHPDLSSHGPAVKLAHAARLGVSVHAGEWGGARQVRAALALDPDRIAHGAPAAEDGALMGDLAARRITLDICPTSNVQANLVRRYQDHPLPRLVRSGVSVTISSDARTVSGTTQTIEYARSIAWLGLSVDDIWRANRHAVEAAFLGEEPAIRGQLLAQFDAFAAHQLRLASPSDEVRQ